MIIPLSTAIIVSNALSGTIIRDYNGIHLDLLNKYRKENGAQELQFDKYLMEGAEIRAQELALQWSHFRPGSNASNTLYGYEDYYTVFIDKANDNGAYYNARGENAAYQFNTGIAKNNAFYVVGEVMDGWKASPGHDANMKNPLYNVVGFGYYKADDGYEYWIQIFGLQSQINKDSIVVKEQATNPFGNGTQVVVPEKQPTSAATGEKAPTAPVYKDGTTPVTPGGQLTSNGTIKNDFQLGSINVPNVDANGQETAGWLAQGGKKNGTTTPTTQPSGSGTDSGTTTPTTPPSTGGDSGTTGSGEQQPPQNPSGGGTNTGDNQNQGSGGSTDTGNQNTGSNGSNTGNQGSQSGSGSNTNTNNNTNTNKPTQKPSTDKTDKEESKEENKPTTPSKPSQSEQDKAEQEKQEAQKAEQERLEAERLEKERLEAEEKARQEAEQKAAEEKAKQEAEQKAKEEAMKAVVVAMMAEEIRQSNPQFKALSEGAISAVTTVLAAADTAATSGMDEASKATSANAATLGAGQTAMAAFGATGGGSMRYKSGSHVDVKGVNVLAGVGFSREFNEGKIMIAPFVEAGWSKYNTYNSFNNAASVEGDGDSSFVGFGALLRYDISGASHPYIEASVRAGELKNKYNAGSVYDRLGRVLEYTTHTPYFSAHVGAGYIFDLGDGLSLDLGAKYLYTHVKSDKVNVAGDKFSFGAVNSHRLRASAKVEKELNENVSIYGGMAYEYEFKGSANASINGRAIKAPSIKGGSGMAEVGFGWYLTKNVRLDISAQGWVGKKQGVNGNIGIKINF